MLVCANFLHSPLFEHENSDPAAAAAAAETQSTQQTSALLAKTIL